MNTASDVNAESHLQNTQRGSVQKRQQNEDKLSEGSLKKKIKKSVCPFCSYPTPQFQLDCKGGSCAQCGMDIYFGRKPCHSPCPGGINCNCILPFGYCHHCYKRLVAIGTARVNGKLHNDWKTRKFHKKCWLEMKENGEFSTGIYRRNKKLNAKRTIKGFGNEHTKLSGQSHS